MAGDLNPPLMKSLKGKFFNKGILIAWDLNPTLLKSLKK